MLSNESNTNDEIAVGRKKSRKEVIKEAVKYCEENGILSDFLKEHAEVVVEALYHELNVNDFLAVLSEEGHEDEKIEIARNLLAEGSTIEFVHKITGLDVDTLNGLQAGL